MRLLAPSAALTFVMALASSTALMATTCPNAGYATTGCNTVITIDPTGTLTAVAGSSPTPYDGNDDNLVGIQNNSSASISSVHLSGGSGNQIFGFDGDGIDGYLTGVGNTTDKTGYGGPDAYFTNISADLTQGTVNFLTPIAAGGFTYFSLENAFTTGSITGTPGTGVTPEPGTLVLLGTGLLGVAARARRRFANKQ